MLTRNLESVFCLSIPKSQGEARNLDSGWRYLDLEICSTLKIRGEAWTLESGRPGRFLENLLISRDDARNLDSGSSGWSELRSVKCGNSDVGICGVIAKPGRIPRDRQGPKPVALILARRVGVL